METFIGPLAKKYKDTCIHNYLIQENSRNARGNKILALIKVSRLQLVCRPFLLA